MFHVAKHSNMDKLSTTDSYDKSSAVHTSAAEEIKHVTVRRCHGVWCSDGTHYVRVNMSQSFGPESTIQQVDEDETFTVEQFFQKEFSLTEAYEDTAKRIRELGGKCCRSVYDTTTAASTPENLSSNARKDAVHFNDLLWRWLQYTFPCISTQKKSGRRTSHALPDKPDLRSISPHRSTTAIMADDTNRCSIDVTVYC